ncbi:hypothetical protein LINPERHAP1_LOCUS41934, partial [Linum perenne]
TVDSPPSVVVVTPIPPSTSTLCSPTPPSSSTIRTKSTYRTRSTRSTTGSIQLPPLPKPPAAVSVPLFTGRLLSLSSLLISLLFCLVCHRPRRCF